MLFREYLAEKILAGEKTATRRLPKENRRSPWWIGGCRYRVGKRFPIMCNFNEPARAYAIVTRVALERLGDIRPSQALHEGAGGVVAFRELWASINEVFDPEQWVWVVEFKLDHSSVRRREPHGLGVERSAPKPGEATRLGQLGL
jgi:uncharacterized protein YhfF